MSRWLATHVVLPLLDLANDAPPVLERKAFYALKRRLLERWAERDGMDVQHVQHACWECQGQGCSRCTKGVYREAYVLLQRWRWGVHSFHTFERRLERPEAMVSIKGYVRHRPRAGHIGAEAWYWLALWYDRRAFWREFGNVGHLARKRTPLVILGTLLFQVRLFGRHLTRRWHQWKMRNDDLPF